MNQDKREIQQMINEVLKTKSLIIPPVKIPPKTNRDMSSILRIGEADPYRVQSYSIQTSKANYGPFFQMMGLKKIADRAYECQIKEHLRIFASLATVKAKEKIALAFPEMQIRNVFQFRSAPCLHDDGEYFIFIGSKEAQAWVEDAGWEFDEDRQIYKTKDALQASALLAFATLSAEKRIESEVQNEQFLKYAKKNPIAGPWATIGLQKKTAVIYAGNKYEGVLTRAGFTKNKAWGRYATFDARTAQPFYGLVPDKKTRIIYGKMPEDAAGSRKLIDLDDVKISELLEIIESPKGAGSKKEKSKAMETLRLDYDRRKSGWRTANPRAEAMGFEKNAEGVYETKDPEIASKLRGKASLLAEVYLQISMAKKFEKSIQDPWSLQIAEPPSGLNYFPDQYEGIEFQMLREHSINADDMGTGKTVMSAGLTATLDPKRSLHVVLPPIMVSYERHMRQWIKKKTPIHIIKANDKPQEGINITPASQFYRNPYIKDIEWDLTIVDEFHRFKNINSQRAAALYSIPTKRSADYSGTPIPNRPQDLYNSLHAKLPEIFNSREMFMRLYGVNQLTIEDPKIEEQKRLLRNLLGSILRRTILIRRIKSLKVKKTRKTVEIKIVDPELEKLLAKENKLLSQLVHSKKQTEKIRLLAEINDLRVQTAKFKIDYAVNYAIDSIQRGNTPLIFANFREIVARIEAGLRDRGYTFTVIAGDRGTPAQRQIEIDKFQAGHNDGVIASYKAGGTGLTITRANHVIGVELDWDPYDMLQAEDRAYRTGQIRDVNVDYLVIARSIDNYIATNNNLKIRNVDDILIPTLDDDLDAIAFQIDEHLEIIEKEEMDHTA